MSAGSIGLLQQAVAELRQGDLAAAAAAASEACRQSPDEPRAQYVAGRVATECRDHAAAATAFAQAVRLAPEWADAWVQLGVAQYRCRQVEPAKTSLRRALELEPGHRGARAALVAYMRASGETAAADALLRETIALQSDNAGARLTLVSTLLHQERVAEALALLEAAPPPDKPAQVRDWQAYRAVALVRSERLEEARAALAALEALKPWPPEQEAALRWPAVLLARAEGDLANASEHAHAIEEALRSTGVSVPKRVDLCFDLGMFWAKQGQPADAMRLWRDAHQGLAADEPFSRRYHTAFIDNSIAALDYRRLNDGARASNTDPAPLFIVGMPRSGTTLCHQILAAHRDVHGAGERMALPNCFGQIIQGADAAEAPGRLAALDTAELDRLADDYLAALHALAPGRTRIVDKMPGNYRLLGLITMMLPGSRIIHCQRDPRDIGLSMFSMRFDGPHPYAHDLADLGFAIGQHLRLMAHWRAVLPGRILTVKLSDWVTQFDATLDCVLRHAGLPADPACAKFYETEAYADTASQAQVRRPVNAQGLGRWRPFAAELAPMIAELNAADALAGWDEPAKSSWAAAK